jgi:precorrin-2/cobalt-factor-2 C20-methyltransferase
MQDRAELTGIGVGPGAPELLTLEASRLMKDADLVFVPTPNIANRSLAAEIAAGAGLDLEKVRQIEFPMSRDSETLRSSWATAAKPVVEALEQGKVALFLTLGDPSVYSTWIYLRRAVEGLRPGTRFGVVPGIMAANAAAARLGIPLVEGNERMVLLPLPDPVDKLDSYLTLAEQLVIYKIGSRLDALTAWVKARNLGDGAFLAVAVGQKREKAGPLLALAPEAEGYLSLAVVRIQGD